MNYIQEFLTTHSVASTMLYLCLTAFTGVMLGKLAMKDIKLGITGVLFAGILVAHFGAPVDEHTLLFVRDFGLILFVYSIGLSMGPHFFSSFKQDGILLNLFAVGIVLGGVAIAFLIHFFSGIPPSAVVGLMCGAVTNTPSLGTVQQALTEQGAHAATISETGMAYAITYPFGVLGTIITMLLIRLFFRINIQSETKDYTESLGNSETQLQSVKITVANPEVIGKNIDYLKRLMDKEFAISRIYRSGMSILPTLQTTLELGDTVKVVGEKEILNNVKQELGDSISELAKPNIISIFFGMFAGIVVGSIPIFIPGLPASAKLGLAGGPLLIAILLGYKGRIGNLSFYMTPGANLFMREMGIILFLSCIGLLSGEKFVETILSGGWQWMLYGIAVTLIPILTVGIIARLMNVNYLKICGLMAGSMTGLPALEFANSIAPVQAQATAYTTVYPLTMFLRVLLAQIFVMMML